MRYLFGFIGCGNMGGTLARIVAKKVGGDKVAVADFDSAKTQAIADEYGATIMTAEEIARGIENIKTVPHRLQLIEANGVYILDDGYNANPRGATEALAALGRFAGRKCVVTPGIVECGVLEEKINGELGAKIADEQLDLVILVGDTLVGIVKKGYIAAGGDETRLVTVRSLEEAKTQLEGWVQTGDAVLFLNDLPDIY